jgi:hypothetical protein
MSSSIHCEYPELPHRHVSHFLCKARKTKTGVSCTVMTDHQSASSESGRRVVDANVKFGRGHSDLQSFGKERGRRDWGKGWVWSMAGFDAWIPRWPLHDLT